MSKELEEINKKLEELLDKKKIFARSIVRGFGTAIGATIVAAIILSIFAAVFRPVLQDSRFRDVIKSYQTK